MKRFHVHVAVDDLEANIRFYSSVFGTEPSVRKDDYAKWMLEDPRVNFAISTRGDKPGVNHLGIQADSDAELKDLRVRLIEAQAPMLEQKEAACCYAKSDKYWAFDPQGIAWETFHTLGSVPVFGEDRAGSKTPEATRKSAACCMPQRPMA
jgi:catechol 2,3-dioxygenase-like lactoylglutathione lyase family enzyme